MRKIIVGAMVSMDGVMQAPGAPTEDPTKGFKFGGWVMPYFCQEFGEELDRIFKEAGFEWREAGCSMCLGMNQDILQPGERCASTSNRNFEGRQGRGGRTHLVSPVMAAAAAIYGHFVDVRELGVLTA